MTIELPPDVDVLRRLVRGKLVRDERIQVDRWLGRCTDERVINVLDNLILEWEEEKADARLPVGSNEGLIARFFRDLVESSKAVVDYLSGEPGFMPAHLGPSTAPIEGLHIANADADATFKVTVNVAQDVLRAIVLATTDNGVLYLLGDVSGSKAHEYFYKLEEEDGRVTFWLVASLLAGIPQNTPSSLAELPPWLDSLSSQETIRIYAARITSAEVLEG